MLDLACPLVNRVQNMTTYGHKACLSAFDRLFGNKIDYVMLQRDYGLTPQGPETPYSPAQCMGPSKAVMNGNPDQMHVSTSYTERQNLTMRMSMRRFTRLANAFCKNLENNAAAVALHFMHYNFARVHQTSRVIPAMAAGIFPHVWSIQEMVNLLS